MRFKDKVALVTGSGSGIGLATAKRLSAEGGRVVIVDVDQSRADAAAASLGQAAGALAVACDVSEEKQVEAAFTKAVEKFARVDVIVNNAGLMIFKPIEQQTEEDWLKILRVDLLGAFYFIKQAFLRMPQGGAIVNVASIHAEQTTPLVSTYAAAKAALVSLTHSAAIEGKPKQIRVNAILPGAVDTPMLWNNPNLASGQEKVDPAYIGKPEQLAAAIAYLASDDSEFIEGAALRVDGGRLARL